MTGISMKTQKAINDLDSDYKTPVVPAAAPASQAPFLKGFTPEQRAAQKAKLVEALRKRAAEPASE